jgi:hypothetical protein
MQINIDENNHKREIAITVKDNGDIVITIKADKPEKYGIDYDQLWSCYINPCFTWTASSTDEY